MATLVAAALGMSTSAALGVSASGPSSPASEDLAAETQLVHQVLEAADPQAAFDALSPTDQQLLQQGLTHQTAVIVYSEPVAAPAPGNSASPSGPDQVTPNAYPPPPGGGGEYNGCWTGTAYEEWSDLGVRDGNTWFDLTWCANNGDITSWSVSNVGGQGLGGFSYDGVIGRGHRDLGWQIRVYREYKFSAFGVTFNPCLQARGAAEADAWSQLTTCNLSA